LKKKEADYNVFSSGTVKEGEFGIDRANIAHIFEVLRKSLYSDAITTVIREYSTNAFDAHVQANNKNPFVVTLPTQSNPTFSVRDFGVGLTQEDVFDTYCMYGTSTKRNSNDYNGMLGLGSKSGFSYADAFSIVSYKGGKKYIFSAFIDETLIGKVSLIAEEDTEEMDGVEIIIPVETRDISLFARRAELIYSFFPKNSITIKNNNSIEVGKRKDIALNSSVFSGNGWYIPDYSRSYSFFYYNNHYSSRVSYAIMGNIAYPIDKQYLLEESSRLLIENGIEIEFNIGDLDISASRESLKYTDETKKTLNSRIESIINEMLSIYSEKIKNANNIWEAYVILSTNLKNLRFDNRLENYVSNNSYWNGIKLSINNCFYRNCGMSIYRYERASRSYAGKSPESVRKAAVNCIVPSDRAFVFINDCFGNKKPQKEREKAVDVLYGNSRNKYDYVYVVNFYYESEDFTSGEVVKNKWFEENHIDDSLFSKLSEYNLPRKETENKQYYGTTKKVYKDYICSYDRGSIGSTPWIEVKTDELLDDCIYVELSRYSPVNSKYFCNNSDISRIFTKLKYIGVDIPQLYGVKSVKIKNISNIMPNAVHIDEFLSEKLTISLNSKENIIKYKEIRSLSENSQISYMCYVDENMKLDKKSLFHDVYDLFSKTKDKYKDRDRFESGFYFFLNNDTKFGIHSIDYKSTECIDFSNELANIYEKYPLLVYLGIGDKNTDYVNIAKYVEMCDALDS
jgi:hypothetical protein